MATVMVMEDVYRRWADRFRGPAGDLAVLIVVALVVFVGNLAIVSGGGQARPIWPAGVALMAVAVAALVWRRAHPVPALGLTAAAAAVYYLMNFPAGLEPVPFLVALYGASSHGYRLVSAIGAAAAVVTVAVVQLAGTDHVNVRELIGVTGWLTVVLVVAEVVRGRRAYLAAVEQRAVDAERSRESEAARRVAEERLRIARELHDALAHHISVINIQAGAALLRRQSRPDLAQEVLPVIKQAAGDAMRECCAIPARTTGRGWRRAPAWPGWRNWSSRSGPVG
jgi:signal transduction histidine kinase